MIRMEVSRVVDKTSDLNIEVIDPEGIGYFYVGSGDRCVLLAEMNVPKWRNSVGLTPENARKLAAALTKMADQSESEPPREPVDD